MSPHEKKRGTVGIRWRLFASLAVFTVLILLVLWLVQIRLLAWFYEREKNRELRQTAATLTNYLEAGQNEDDGFSALVSDIARDTGTCIRVFHVEGGELDETANANVTAFSAIGLMNAAQFRQYYDRAVESGGAYSARVTLRLAREHTEKEGRYAGVNVVYAAAAEANGIRYLLLLDGALSPVDATVSTLRAQFSWIAASMLIAAFVLALVLSKMVATPLKAITAQAGQLAAGHYEADFAAHGYREVKELADALNFAAEEISKTDTLQKELIANISHDLRTPLTMIRGYAEMVRDIPGENSPENLQVIIDETTRLSELVCDLMDLSKLQAGTKKPELAVFDLTETVRDTIHRYDALVRHKGYRIEVETCETAPVFADRTMILQVIYNLINNAVNYTGETLRVRVSLTKKDGSVRFAVADDGAGIKPELIPQIWDRYYRVDKVHKQAVMGTGLGLAIVKSVLEAHGARYGVDSAVGIGSIFWFELPLAEEPPEEEL